MSAKSFNENEIFLSELSVGDLAEIVSIEKDTIFQSIGAHVGMSVMVLRKAVASLIQIGFTQFEVSNEILNQIRVKRVIL